MDANPYKAPKEQQATADQPVYPAVKTSWRIVPAVLVGILGVAVLWFGLVAVRMMLYFWSELNSADAPSERVVFLFFGVQLLFITMLFASGCLWIASAVAFWMSRWKSAYIRFALGGAILAVPVLLTLIGRMSDPS